MFTPKIGLAAYYNALMRARGFEIAPHHLPICQALEDFRINNLMIVTGPGNGKSTITSVVYPSWKLGHDPSSTILGTSAAENLMAGFLSGVQEIIQGHPVFQRLFPDVKPDKVRGWSGERGLFVTGRPLSDPDPSFFACGIGSSTLTGKHAKTILMDDIHDDQNSSTEEACQKIVDKFYGTILGRADPQGCRYIMSGRRFSINDLYGHFIESGDWTVMILPAERPGETRLWWDIIVPKDRKTGDPMPCYFSENSVRDARQDESKPYITYKAFYGLDPDKQGFYWPGKAGMAKRKEYFQVKRNSPAKAEAAYQCAPGYRNNAVFIGDDFTYYSDVSAAALRMGRSSLEVETFIRRMGGKVVQAWDTGFGKSADSAYSVCVTAVFFLSKSYWRGEDPALFGPCDRHNRVFILDVFRDRLDFAELSREVRRQHMRWIPDLVLVENRASGISLLQTLKSSSIPLRAVEAKEGKVERAMDAVGGGAGSVQGWFRQHRVVLPIDAKWVPDFKAEFIDFQGTRSGRKDQVDATVYLVTYAIETSIGAIRMPSDEIMEISAAGSRQADNLNDFASYIGRLNAAESINPFLQMCNHCDHWQGRPETPWGGVNGNIKPWCGRHNRPSAAIDSCEDFEEIQPPKDY